MSRSFGLLLLLALDPEGVLRALGQRASLESHTSSRHSYLWRIIAGAGQVAIMLVNGEGIIAGRGFTVNESLNCGGRD